MKEKKETEIKVSTIITWGSIALLCLLLVFQSFFIVEEGYRGVLLTFGEINEVPKEPGFHFKIPFVQRVVHLEVKTQKYEASASAASQDLQMVNTDVALNYRLIASETPEVYRTLGIAYEQRVIQPAVQEAVKAVSAQYNAENLIVRRAEVKESIEDALKERLLRRNIQVEEISLTDFRFSSSFDEAIEAKVTAEQEALRAKNELEKVRIEAEQKVAQAEGEALSRRELADADAYSVRVRAESEAFALKVVREELEQANELIEYKAVEKWSGNLPMITGGGALPFLNIDSIATR